jgi:hypothetical protein
VVAGGCAFVEVLGGAGVIGGVATGAPHVAGAAWPHR